MIEIRHGKWESVLSSLRDVDLVFTSPPYNIGSKAPRRDGFRGKGLYDPKSYGGITGYADSLPQDAYEAGQIRFLNACASMLADDGVVVYNHKPRRQNGKIVHPLQWIFQVEQLELTEEIVWDRGSTHNHCNRLFWPQTERLYVLKKAGATYRFRNHKGLEFRSDLWRVPLSNRPQDGHACPFAVALARGVIEAFTLPGEMVCDPYSGSGTTAVACQQLGRRFVGSEASAKYHRQSVARLEVVA